MGDISLEVYGHGFVGSSRYKQEIIEIDKSSISPVPNAHMGLDAMVRSQRQISTETTLMSRSVRYMNAKSIQQYRSKQ